MFGGEDVRCTIEAGPKHSDAQCCGARQHEVQTVEPYKYPGEDVVRDAVPPNSCGLCFGNKDSSMDRSGSWKTEKDRKWFERVVGTMRELDAFRADVKG